MEQIEAELIYAEHFLTLTQSSFNHLSHTPQPQHQPPQHQIPQPHLKGYSGRTDRPRGDRRARRPQGWQGKWCSYHALPQIANLPPATPRHLLHLMVYLPTPRHRPTGSTTANKFLTSDHLPTPPLHPHQRAHLPFWSTIIPRTTHQKPSLGATTANPGATMQEPPDVNAPSSNSAPHSYILNSAAFPTHLSKLISNMCPSNGRTLTATCAPSPITHAGPFSIRVTSNPLTSPSLNRP